MNKIDGHLGSWFIKSLLRDHENWRVKITEKMKVTVPFSNNQILLRLICDVLRWGIPFSETRRDANCERIHGKQQALPLSRVV